MGRVSAASDTRVAVTYGPLYDTLLVELAAGVVWGPAWRAIMLGASPEAAEALLRGERVPADRLDVAAMKRFGLERRAA